MKKVILAIVAIFAMSTAANAQIQNIGVRGLFGNGSGAELSTMWGLGGNRLEADLGWRGNSDWSYLNLRGIYQWTGEIGSGFGWYAGLGANLGIYLESDNDHDGFGLGFAAQAGLEYNFSIPLQITLDFTPQWDLIGYSGFGYGVALGLRYRF